MTEGVRSTSCGVIGAGGGGAAYEIGGGRGGEGKRCEGCTNDGGSKGGALGCGP